MRKKTKLKGSSLIEVLVSLVIISIVIALAMGSYLKVIKVFSTHSIKRMMQLEKIAKEAIHDQDFKERRYRLDDGTVVLQSVEYFQDDTLLYQYELKTEPLNTRETLTLRKIIRKKHE